MSKRVAATRRKRARLHQTRFNPSPVKVTKIDQTTGEVISEKWIKDPLSYDKKARTKYFIANKKSISGKKLTHQQCDCHNGF